MSEGPEGTSKLETSKVVELYKDMVFSIALTHTRSRHDAEDVFQEVFLTYQRKQPAFDDAERRRGWLIVTAINCAKQCSMSSWHRKVALGADVADVADTAGMADVADTTADEAWHFRSDEQDALFAAFQELPEKYRSVLHLFYFEDLPVAQISALLDILPGTVKTQLSRGRSMLRDSLVKAGHSIPEVE